MTRLFDAEKEQQVVADTKARQNEVRRRAAEFDQAVRDNNMMDLTASEIAKMVNKAESVRAIRYDSYRPPGGRITVEHAADGKDYVFQVFPLRPPAIAEPDVLMAMIVAMDAVFPKSVQVNYTPPAEIMPQKFFTVKVKDVIGMPGWQDAVGRALAALAELALWP